MTILAFFVVGGTTGADIVEALEKSRRRGRIAAVLFTVFAEYEIVVVPYHRMKAETFKM
jgi:hypothetical protein